MDKELKEYFDSKFDEMEDLFDSKLEKMESSFDSKLEKMESSFDSKLEKMESSFDSKLEKMESSIREMQGDIREIKTKLIEHDEHFENIEMRLVKTVELQDRVSSLEATVMELESKVS